MNPQETPEAYDLSKVEDLGKLSNGLTLDERKALREKFVQEKQAIIYLTQSEVQSLKDTLRASGNAHIGTRVERVASFLEQQKSEGLNLGDVFEGSSELSKEALIQIENISKENLFGPSGALKDISLSETAKNNIISAFALAALSEIGTTTDSPDVIVLLEGSAKNLKLLGEAASLKETVGPGIEKRALDIDAKGEQNSIFMNVQEGKLFFTQLFKGDYATTQEVIDAIERKNIPAGENIPQLSPESLEELQSIAVQDVQDTPKNIDDIIPDAVNEELGALPDEEEKSLLEQWKESGNPFLQFIAAILEVGKEISGNRDSDTNTKFGTQDTAALPDTSDDKIDSETTHESLKANLLDLPALDLGEINKKRLTQDLENPEFFKKIQSLLEGIDIQKDAADTLKELFGEKHTFQKFSAELKTAKYPRLSDISQYSAGNIFEGVLTEYARYRNSPGVQGKETNRTTWEEWAQIRKTQTWSTDGK